MELLPTRDCEVGYGPGENTKYCITHSGNILSDSFKQIDKQIAVVKGELKRRKNYGRLAVKHGCGLWCCGLFIGCNCADRSPDVDLPKEFEDAQYDNRGLDVSDVNVDAGSGVKGNAQSDTPPTEPVGNGHDPTNRAGSSSLSSSSSKEKDDETEMTEKSVPTSNTIVDDDGGENTKL